MRGDRRFVVLVGVGLILGLAGCAQTPPKAAAPSPEATQVRLETTAGVIVLQLDAERAPISVANFLAYADRGAYDGTVFHRVVPGFVIQGGGYTQDLVELKSEAPIRNEWQNGLKNMRGTIAMAREVEPDTATREFYINLVDNAKLDTARATTGSAGYAVFGRVVEGMEVVDVIAAGETTTIPDRKMENVPVRPVVLLKVSRVAPGANAKRAVGC